MENSSQPKKRVIRCPHCKAVLEEGGDLCCDALRTELNQLAQKQGSDIMLLMQAFERWFQEHKVEDGTLS